MQVDSAWLRRLAYLGARYAPRSFVRHSPSVIGLMFALGLPTMRHTVRRNIRRVMGPRRSVIERYDTARTFMNYAACLAEGIALERPEARVPRFRIEGEQHLARAMASGEGLILVTAHVGPFEAAASYFARKYSSKLMLVMRKEPNEAAGRFHDELRRRRGVLVAHVGDHALDALPVLSHLQQGGFAAIQLDRVPGQTRHLETTLFGGSWRLPIGPFRLAALCQVPIMTVFARRRGFFDYEIVVGEPLRVSRADLDGLEGLAQRLATDVERAILRDPTQWFHFVP